MPKSQLYGNVARYLATPPTLTDGDFSPLMVDQTGALIVSSENVLAYLLALPGGTTPGNVLTVNAQGDGFEFIAP